MEMQDVILKDWLRGTGALSRLYCDVDEQSCCVGLMLQQLYGFSKERLAGLRTLADLDERRSFDGDVPLKTKVDSCVSQLYGINDKKYHGTDSEGPEITDTERVTMLNTVSEPHGIRFVLDPDEGKP